MSRLDGFVTLAAFLACLVLFVRATVFSRQQVRRMTWRTRLRMRPGAGFASHWEIMFRFSRPAAMYHGRRCRPDLRFTDRLTCPATAYAVRLGRAQLGRTIYARGEDQVRHHRAAADQQDRDPRRPGLQPPRRLRRRNHPRRP